MVPGNWTALVHTVIQGSGIFLSVAPPSPMACGHPNAAEERRNLGLEATRIPSVYSLWSNTGHKKYPVTQPCLEAWGGGAGGGVAGKCPLMGFSTTVFCHGQGIVDFGEQPAIPATRDLG